MSFDIAFFGQHLNPAPFFFSLLFLLEFPQESYFWQGDKEKGLDFYICLGKPLKII